MSNVEDKSTNWRSRLWALPLFLGGGYSLVRGWGAGTIHHLLLGGGMLLAGLFALRHSLTDTSPSGLDPKRMGAFWAALLVAAVLLILGAAITVLLA